MLSDETMEPWSWPRHEVTAFTQLGRRGLSINRGVRDIGANPLAHENVELVSGNKQAAFRSCARDSNRLDPLLGNPAAYGVGCPPCKPRHLLHGEVRFSPVVKSRSNLIKAALDLVKQVKNALKAGNFRIHRRNPMYCACAQRTIAGLRAPAG